MPRRLVEPEAPPSRAITLFPRDTVLRALHVMHRYGLHLLPVVDEQRGELLGEVTEGELHRIWRTLPLARLSEVLTARETGPAVGIAARARPVRGTLVPGVASSPWLH